MAWVRIDDQIGRHPKLLSAGPAAAWLWVLGLAHCQSLLTNGFIAESVVPLLGIPKGYRPLVDRLIAAQLWHPAPGGYQVHDYLKHNESRDAALTRQTTAHEAKVRAGRIGGQRSGVSRREAEGKQPATPLLKQNEAEAKQTDEAKRSPIRTDQDQNQDRSAVGSTSTGAPVGEKAAFGARPTEADKPKKNIGFQRIDALIPSETQRDVWRLAAVAKAVLQEMPDMPQLALEDEVKVRAARLKLDYDSARVGAAVRFELVKRGAKPSEV